MNIPFAHDSSVAVALSSLSGAYVIFEFGPSLKEDIIEKRPL